MIPEILHLALLKGVETDPPAIRVDALPAPDALSRTVAALSNRPLGGCLFISGLRGEAESRLTFAKLDDAVQRAASRCSEPPKVLVSRGDYGAAVAVAPGPRPTSFEGLLPILFRGQVRTGSDDDLRAIRDARGDLACEREPTGIPWTLEGDIDAARAAGMVAEDGTLTVAGAMALLRTDTPPLRSMSVCLRRFRVGFDDAAGRSVPSDRDRSYGPPIAETIELLALQLSADLTKAPVRRSQPLPRALRELLANAFIHRSHNGTHAEVPILVLQYTNGVAIESAGSLPLGHVSYTNQRVLSAWCRNPYLAAHLGESGVIAQRGDGLVVARENARIAGYELVVDAREHSVIASLRPHADAASHATLPPVRQRLPMSERDNLVVKHLRSAGEATAQQISAALEVPPSTIRAVLKRLTERQLVVATDPSMKSPKQSYRLAPVE